MNIKIAIFDDNKSLLDSIAMLVSNAKGCTLCGAFLSAENCVEHIENNLPDVIIMDIEMPGVSGIEATRQIKSLLPEISILIQTVFEDDEKVFEALCAGASGYLLKNTSPAKILEAIREVYEGGAPMSPSIAKKVIGSFHKTNEITTAAKAALLTEREMEVLQALVKGRSYKMIAGELNVSYGTIHSHMKNIYKKLHVNSMTEAVAKALHNKIVR